MSKEFLRKTKIIKFCKWCGVEFRPQQNSKKPHFGLCWNCRKVRTKMECSGLSVEEKEKRRKYFLNYIHIHSKKFSESIIKSQKKHRKRFNEYRNKLYKKKREQDIRKKEVSDEYQKMFKEQKKRRIEELKLKKK